MTTSKEKDDLFSPESWRLAMMHAVLFWPGVTISDGAFNVLNQVAEYRRTSGQTVQEK